MTSISLFIVWIHGLIMSYGIFDIYKIRKNDKIAFT